MANPNIGYATISIIPSMSGIDTRLRQSLSIPLGKAGKQGGDEAGSSFLSGFKGVAKAGAIGVGIAVGAVVAKGFSQALGNEVANDKFAASLGLPPERAKELGKVAGSLYADAYGDSLGTVNEALKSVLQSGAVQEDIDNGSLERLTAKALDLGVAFDQDVGGPAKAAGQLIRNGLAKDADEAFDILTRGFQEGADKSGDLIDTFNEYSTLFRDIGLDGATATGLLTQGLKAGARDADKVADALKEFAIRGQDASVLSAEGFELIGLNAAKMTKAVAAGGPEAKAALQQVLDGLRKTEDPVKRNAAAVALFGTQAEDLGDALYALDPSQAVARLGNVEGAAARLGDTLNDNTSAKIESFKRSALQGLTDFIGGTVIPGAERLVNIFEEEGLGGVVGRAGTFIETQAPIFGEKVLALADKLVDWIEPKIPVFLEKLGKFLGDGVIWILEEGVPLLAEGIGKLIPVMWNWITDSEDGAIVKLVEHLPGFIEAFTTWLDDELVPAALEGGREAGSALVGGIFEALGDSFKLPGGAKLKIPGTGIELEIPEGLRRAAGGPVRAGQPYVVGEHRAEWFVPERNGTIFPRVPGDDEFGGRGAGGNTYVQHIYNPTPEPASDSVRALRKVGREMAA